MNITTTSNYYTLLLLLTDPEFVKSFGKVSFKQPEIDLEGLVGYVKVDVVFEDIGLTNFARKWAEYQYSTLQNLTATEHEKKDRQINRLISLYRSLK